MSSEAVVINLTANLFQFTLRFVLGIWFTRFLIHNLGVELYGLLPLAYGVSQYFSLITLILNAPSGRFLIIALSQNNYEEANKIFNTVFWGICGICIVLIFACSAISYSAPLFLSVPIGHDLDARLLFLAVSFAFIVLTFGNPFSLSTYVTNKLYLRFLGGAFQNVIRVSVPAILMIFLGWQIGAVSFGIITAAITGFVLSFFFWKHLTPELQVQNMKIDFPLLKQITTMGGWMLIIQIGALLFLQSELFVVNILHGAKASGRYGALLIFPTMLRAVSGMVSGNLNPIIMDRYAKNDMDGVFRIVFKASRLLGIGMALPLGLICVFSSSLLEIWLGSEFIDMAPVLIVLVSHLCINLTVLPIFSLQTMANKVKIPSIATLLLGFINVLLAIVLGNPKLPLGIIGVPLAGAIALTIKNAIFTPIYGSMILNIKRRVLFYPIVAGIISFLMCILLSFITIKFNEITTLFQLLKVWMLISIVYVLIAWVFLFSKDEKKMLHRFISKLSLFK